jgi:hypothetical protein
MPMFYFVPFKLTSDAERKTMTPVIELGPTRDVVLFVIASIVFLGMFFALAILPTIIALREAAVPAA